MWPASSVDFGTRWHCVHATGDDRPDVAFRCDWCAPMLTRVVAVPSLVSTGGAGLSALPWQLAHPIGDSSTMPFTCCSGLAMPPAIVAVSWHWPHFVETGCGAAGGRP